jgi:hypothetical protein
MGSTGMSPCLWANHQEGRQSPYPGPVLPGTAQHRRGQRPDATPAAAADSKRRERGAETKTPGRFACLEGQWGCARTHHHGSWLGSCADARPQYQCATVRSVPRGTARSTGENATQQRQAREGCRSRGAASAAPKRDFPITHQSERGRTVRVPLVGGGGRPPDSPPSSNPKNPNPARQQHRAPKPPTVAPRARPRGAPPPPRTSKARARAGARCEAPVDTNAARTARPACGNTSQGVGRMVPFPRQHWCVSTP